MSFSSKYLVKSLSACSVDLRVFVASFFLTISLISKLVISANLLLFAPELSELLTPLVAAMFANNS